MFTQNSLPTDIFILNKEKPSHYLKQQFFLLFLQIGENVPEDWRPWSSWIWSDDLGWFRERSCKNSLTGGNCRGPHRQKRTLKKEWIQKKNEEEEDEEDDDYSLVLSDGRFL